MLRAGAMLRRAAENVHRATVAKVAVRWRRSLQFKTVLATLLLVIVAAGGIGAFLSHQIAGALYEERLTQFQAEATAGLSSVKENFRTTAATDREGTERLVSNTLSLLEGRGAETPRRYLLAPLPDQENLFVATLGDRITAGSIPAPLSAAVEGLDPDGEDIVHWSALALAHGEPGIAFGTKVTLPPDRSEYALYLVYDLDTMQQTLDDIHRILWIAGGLLLAIIGTIAWVVTKAGVGAVSAAASVRRNWLPVNSRSAWKLRAKTKSPVSQPPSTTWQRRSRTRSRSWRSSRGCSRGSSRMYRTSCGRR